METLRVDNVADLIQKLMCRYGIEEQTADTAEGWRKLYVSKITQNRELECKIKSLQKQNRWLQENSNNHLQQEDSQLQKEVKKLKEQVAIYQRTFKKEDQFVGELKQMLLEKQEKVKMIMEEYEAQLDHGLKNSSIRNSEDFQYEIQHLSQIVKEQEALIVNLASSNARSVEQNRHLKKTMGEMSRISAEK